MSSKSGLCRGRGRLIDGEGQDAEGRRDGEELEGEEGEQGMRFNALVGLDDFELLDGEMDVLRQVGYCLNQVNDCIHDLFCLD